MPDQRLEGVRRYQNETGLTLAGDFGRTKGLGDPTQKPDPQPLCRRGAVPGRDQHLNGSSDIRHIPPQCRTPQSSGRTKNLTVRKDSCPGKPS
jgi:hypothetical protein